MKVLRIFLVLIFSATATFAQTIDSVLFISDPEFVFTYRPYHQKTATFHITAYDANGQPVGEGVVLAISVDYAVLKGPTLFKSEISSDTTLGNYYYFKTDANGKIEVDFYPYKFIRDSYADVKNYVLWTNPDATEEDIMKEYRRRCQISLNFWNVRFSDPNNEQTAEAYYILYAKKASVFPVLYSFNTVVIHAPARDGSPYIFTAENLKVDPIKVSIQVLDMFNKPIPEGCYIRIRTEWGWFYGDAIVADTLNPTLYYSDGGNVNSSFSGGGYYYVRIGKQGRINLTYQPPPTSMVPFTDWANLMLKLNNYPDIDAAWKAYTSNSLSIPGTAVFYEITGAAPDQYYANSFWMGFNFTNPLVIDSSRSILPALVSVDKISIETESKRNGYYVYASETYSEAATVTVRAYDSSNRPAPKGTPIALYLNRRKFYGGENAMISGETVEAYWYNGKDVFFILRLGEGGVAKVQYRAPFMPFSDEYYTGVSGDLTYDERYSGLFHFFPVPFYGWWGWWEAEQGVKPHWFVPYFLYNNDNPHVCVEYNPGTNIYPVVVGPQSARAYFHPSTLAPFKYKSRLNVYVKGPFGIPAPKGSNVFVTVSDGALQGDKSSIDAIITGKKGKATLTYFSPTRSMTYTWGYDKIKVYQFSGGYQLTSRSIKLIGPAASWHDFNLSKWILGFDIVEFIKDLNPLKALGAMKDFVEYAEKTGQQWNQLYQKIFDGTATDADFDAYQQSWQKMAGHIANLAQTIPNTSITGPDLSAGDLFKSLATSGWRHTLKNTLQEKLIEGPKKKMINDFFVFHLSKFFPDSGNRIQSNWKTSATYSYHMPKGLGKLELLTDLFTLPSETGMYEMYSYRFRIHVQDSVLLNSAVQIGDQWPIDRYLIPERYSLFGYPEESMIASNGFFEITDINPQENYMEGIAIGYLFNDPQVNPVLAFSRTIGADGDTLTTAGDARLIVPADALTDSTLLFLLQTRAPLPLIEQDSIIVQSAYSVGSMTADSLLQSVTFNQNATLQIIDITASPASNPWQAYRFDAQNQNWVKITDAGYVNDTLFALPVTQTGVYGLGRKGYKHNEYPVLSSFKDTTIVMNSKLELTFSAYDPEGAPLTIWAESDQSQVQATVTDTVLQVTPAQDWTGVAYVSLLASDGQDTSVSRFKLSVVDLTALEDLASLPKTFELYQNFPNPFNSSTTIRFDVPRATQVRLEIYNILGQRVRQLLNNRLQAGSYRLIWDGRDELGRTVSSGIYICVFRSKSFVKQKRMTLIK